MSVLWSALNNSWISVLDWFEALLSASGGRSYWISAVVFVFAVRFLLMPFTAAAIHGSLTGSDDPADKRYRALRNERAARQAFKETYKL